MWVTQLTTRGAGEGGQGGEAGPPLTGGQQTPAGSVHGGHCHLPRAQSQAGLEQGTLQSGNPRVTGNAQQSQAYFSTHTQ